MKGKAVKGKPVKAKPDNSIPAETKVVGRNKIVRRFLCLINGNTSASEPLLALQMSHRFEVTDTLQRLDDDTGIFDFEQGALGLNLLLDGKPNRLVFSLTEGETGYRARRVSKSNELIARALGVKPHYRPEVIDATAGMGRDAFIMAGLGCKVTLYERCLPIRLLLEDALRRLAHQPAFADIHARLCFTPNDSRDALRQVTESSVIYLDPMFPERKKSALVKKEMRLFKRLAGEDEDADDLLHEALASGAKRIVVKRPKGAPQLAGKNPSHRIEGKKFRFDVYLKNPGQECPGCL